MYGAAEADNWRLIRTRNVALIDTLEWNVEL